MRMYFLGFGVFFIELSAIIYDNQLPLSSCGE